MHNYIIYPNDWQKRTLGSLAIYINGRAFKPADWGTTGLPIIRIEQINNPKSKGDYFNGEVSDNHLVDNGDLLFSWSATLTTLIWTHGPAVLNQHIFKVQPKENTNLHFLHHLLEFLMDDLVGHTHGSTMKHIKSSDLLPFVVRTPDPSEQQHIANILDTLDTQIHQTEQLIAKLKQIKLGLLHDLLTRGIDENGEVRDPVAHPEKFKKTVLGKVPQKWQVSTLGDVVLANGGFIQTGPFGSQLHAREYVPEGIPVIMPQDILGEHINRSQIAYITLAKAETLARHRIEFNDVIFGRRGDLSRCALVDRSEIGSICGTGCLLVRPPNWIIDGRWLAAIYRHHRSQQQIQVQAVGSTMVNLNTTLLAKLVIAAPPLIEQKAIMDKIATFTDDISIEESDLVKLKQIKKGLMHDLLTGRVRVTQLIAECEHLSSI